MSAMINVGMAEIKVTLAPHRLVTTGLGSCIGLCLYDPVSKVGGMAHIVLPTVTNLSENDPGGKYAVTAIPLLVDSMVKFGANRYRLVAKMAGGAEMFTFPGQTSILKIGERNAQTIKEILEDACIPLVGAEIGGNFGRT
ncbi:MAG TPA: chemotaxis protein CheD, partial [Verrucomicrobiae bacterium]|nr:chemotaxis protein CheD [Verrucomicrobiae bacterium]